MILLDALFPVFALILLGYLLKQYGLVSESFLKASDRLVYLIFVPALLFWKIGGAAPDPQINSNLYLSAISATITIFIISLAAIKLFKISAFQAGAFSQSCYRFNTYIGLAVVMNLLGETGIRHFGIMVGFIIPLANVMAVATLIWYSGRPISQRQRVVQTVKSLVSNPLVVASLAGIVYSRTLPPFPAFVDNTLQLAAIAALPLALISIGAALNFNALKKHYRLSTLATVLKIIALPLIGFLFLTFFSVTGDQFKIGMIFFTLPTSTMVPIISSQLNSDAELGSSIILLSTMLSFFTISVALLM